MGKSNLNGANYCYRFGIWWSDFVKEAELCVGDTCIFECTGNRLEFNICIERHEAHDFTVANLDNVVLVS